MLYLSLCTLIGFLIALSIRNAAGLSVARCSFHIYSMHIIHAWTFAREGDGLTTYQGIFILFSHILFKANRHTESFAG